MAWLQEIEMGTSSVARDAAAQYLVRSRAERGNINAHRWADALQQAVGSSFDKVRGAQDSAVAEHCAGLAGTGVWGRGLVWSGAWGVGLVWRGAWGMGLV